jgi:hypothetical protein
MAKTGSCAYCQRERHLKFKEAWARANVAEKTGVPISMTDVDRLLHAKRARKGGAKVEFDAALGSLPFGVMFKHQNTAYLVSPCEFLPWSSGGHGERVDMYTAVTVAVLTPRSGGAGLGARLRAEISQFRKRLTG